MIVVAVTGPRNVVKNIADDLPISIVVSVEGT